MDIKDYLHLYLGAGCIMKPGKSQTEESYSTVQWADIGYPHEIQALILRPLSDITEDEIKELFKYNEIQKSYSNIRLERNIVMNNVLTGITIHYDTITPEGTFSNSWTLRFSSMNAHDFKWLLSKGFDLFGLIHAGLAIEKPNFKL